jgi:hypothetical protein
VQEKVVEANKDKPFQLLGLDLWNGSTSQVNEFSFVTKVQFPVLQKARNPEFSFGLGVENIIVVDPDGIVRGWFSEVETEKINDLISLILDPAPVSELRPKSLYWGLTGQVGVENKIPIKVENTGLEPLEVRDIRSSTAQVLVDRTSFTVAPGESETFVVTLSPTEAGTLTGSVEVITNEKNWSLPIASIEIASPPSPAIALPVTSLDYGSGEVGRPISQTIEIRNDGPGPLNVTGLESDIEGLSYSERVFTVAAGETKMVTISLTPGNEGTISGVINVLSDDPANGNMSIDLAGSAQIIPADVRADFDGSGAVDFSDFLGFADAFGKASGTYDIDQSGTVDFADFLVFVENFGRRAL